MAQYELDLRDYGRILIKRKKIILFASLLVGLVTFIVTPQPKPYYKAKASVRVTQSSTMAGLFVQAISYSRWNNLETQAKILRSLPVVTMTAQRMGKVDSTMSLNEIVNSSADIGTINDMTANIFTEQYGKTDIVDVITTAGDPNEARLFANTLADVFVEYSTNDKNQQVDKAATFIFDQLTLYMEKLESIESEIQFFKRNNLNVISLSPSAMYDLKNELDLIMSQRESLETQLAQLLTRRDSPEDSFIDMFQIEETGAAGGYQSALGELNRKLVALQMEKETLLIYQTSKSPEILDLEQQIQKLIKDLVREFEVRFEELEAREILVRQRLDEVPKNDLIFDRLLREKNVNMEIYSLLRMRYQEAQIKQSERITEMSVVEKATYAQKFISGGKWSKTVLGLVVGLLLGLVVAFVLETLDTSIGAITDVEEYLKTTVLGVIPHFDKEEVRARLLKSNPNAANDQYLDFHSILVAQFRPKSPIAEAYRTLATNIDFVRLNKAGANQFVMTSATMQEGKSTTLANLAIAMAQMGHRTLVIGCNMRRPSLYKIFGLEIGPGVRDISLGLVHWREAVRNINDIALGKMSVTEELLRDGAWSRLHIVTCGAIYHNPTEILSTPKMVEFLRESQDEFDVVLIDCPPILPVTDAAILGSKVDGVILVYQVGKVARGALKRAKAHLEAVNSDVWGVVLNDFKAEISGFSPDTAYYGKYYGGDADEKLKSQSGFERFISNIPNIDTFKDFAADKFSGFRERLHRTAEEEEDIESSEDEKEREFADLEENPDGSNVIADENVEIDKGSPRKLTVNDAFSTEDEEMSKIYDLPVKKKKKKKS